MKSTKNKNIIVGNWKMNPESLIEAKKLFTLIRNKASKLKKTDTVLCPPYPFLSLLKRLKRPSGFFLGAQNSFYEKQGPYTGEVSPSILKDLDVSFVILGHSERREMGEEDEIISRKVRLAAETGLKIILCVGEKQRDEEGGYLTELKTQIKMSLYKFPRKYLDKLIIAYEPVWAIGGRYDAVDGRELHTMVIFIKKTLSEMYGRNVVKNIPVLYGGSVGPNNTLDIMTEGKVQGLLVGRQSLKPDNFIEILDTVDLV